MQPFSLYFINGGSILQPSWFVSPSCPQSFCWLDIKQITSTIMTFVFIHSLQMRCTILNSSGDDLLRVLLILVGVLPLGKCFSVDRYILEETATLKPTEAKNVEMVSEDGNDKRRKKR